MSIIIPPYLRIISGGNSDKLNRRNITPAQNGPDENDDLKIAANLRKNFSLSPLLSFAEANNCLKELLTSESPLSLGEVHSNLDYHKALQLLI